MTLINLHLFSCHQSLWRCLQSVLVRTPKLSQLLRELMNKDPPRNHTDTLKLLSLQAEIIQSEINRRGPLYMWRVSRKRLLIGSYYLLLPRIATNVLSMGPLTRN